MKGGVYLPKAEESPVYVKTPHGIARLHGWKVIHQEGYPTRAYEVVTDDYEMIQHEEVIDLTKQTLEKAGYDIIDESLTVEGRYKSRLFYKALLWEYEPVEKDKIGLGIMVTNSYDRSLGLVTYLYGLRLICLNEMVFGNEILKLKTIHKGETIAERFIKNLLKTLEALETVQTYIKRLIRAEIPTELIDAWLDSLKLAERYRKLILRQLRPDLDRVTAWELYNAYTYVITHKAKMNYMRKTELLRKLNVSMLALVNTAQRGVKA